MYFSSSALCSIDGLKANNSPKPLLYNAYNSVNLLLTWMSLEKITNKQNDKVSKKNTKRLIRLQSIQIIDTIPNKMDLLI